MSLELSGKPDAVKVARPVWGWGRGVIPRPTPPFRRVFGRAEWALMFILARGGKTFARLRFNVGPGVSLNVRVKIDYTRPFDGCELAEWEQSYLTNVQPQVPSRNTHRSIGSFFQSTSSQDPFDVWPDHELENADQAPRKGLFS